MNGCRVVRERLGRSGAEFCDRLSDIAAAERPAFLVCIAEQTSEAGGGFAGASRDKGLSGNGGRSPPTSTRSLRSRLREASAATKARAKTYD